MAPWFCCMVVHSNQDPNKVFSSQSVTSLRSLSPQSITSCSLVAQLGHLSGNCPTTWILLITSPCGLPTHPSVTSLYLLGIDGYS